MTAVSSSVGARSRPAKVKQMDAVLRSHIQFQGEVASFVFAGSEPGLMRQLFEDRERPLYGQADPDVS